MPDRTFEPELLNNPYFKEWVLFPDQDNQRYWQHWLKENPDRHMEALQAREIILRLRFRESSLGQEQENQLLDHVLSGKHSHHHRFYRIEPSGTLITINRVASIAATFIIGALCFWLLIRNNESEPENISAEIPNVVRANPPGLKTRITLPDGSLVILNSESSLEFPARFEGNERLVILEGEAFFEVAKDHEKPFLVESGNLIAKVLGTSFNIKSYQDEKETQLALVTGKLEILPNSTSNNLPGIMLNPGQKLVFDHENKNFQTIPFDLLLETGWKDGWLVFQNDGFDSFISKLSRWYGVKFNILKRPAQKWNIDGKFKNESLKEVLDGLAFTHQLDYQLNNKSVTLNFKNKNEPRSMK